MTEFNLDLNEFELPEKPTLDEALEALQSYDQGVPNSAIVYGLSDLNPRQIISLKPIWDALTTESRVGILNALLDASENDVELNYESVGIIAIEDSKPAVRKAAISLMWEVYDFQLMERLIRLLENDESVEVRAEAAKSLGRFILAGELGDLGETEVMKAQDSVVQVLNDELEDVEVRRRALEAISNSSHEIVPESILDAYNSGVRVMQVSAIFAMGRSCDVQWSSTVLRELGSADPEIQYESARAAGELQLEEAVPNLIRLWAENDPEIQEVVIWSLGEIGTKEAIRVLQNIQEDLEESGDSDFAEAVDDALGNAELMSGKTYLFD